MLDTKSEVVLDFIKDNPSLSSKEIHTGLQLKVGYATVKRVLTKLNLEKLILTKGKGKGTKYEIAPSYKLFYKIDVDNYFEEEVDDREIHQYFELNLISSILKSVSLFTNAESEKLNDLQDKYEQNIAQLSTTQYKNELERLAIDLSWKSSQIEGNTYSLLETERLLKERQTAGGKTKEEAIMLLNHKDALDFIIETPCYITPLTIACIKDIHSILIKDLGIERNIRNRRVGISGTNYRPLDNEFQIKEALQGMCDLVSRTKGVFEKAFLVLILISYIQPFGDGNKRTARILSNAILINNDYCPISFRTIDSIEYKKALLIFYEQNNITAFKKIFINQFEFAVNTYF